MSKTRKPNRYDCYLDNSTGIIHRIAINSHDNDEMRAKAYLGYAIHNNLNLANLTYAYQIVIVKN